MPRSQLDLHKLAQVFLGMAISIAKTGNEYTPDARALDVLNPTT